MKAHVSPAELRGKTIDGHAHVGMGLKAYACLEYPYGQTLEGLYYKQKAGGVDVNVIFPASGSLYFEPAALAKGEMRPAAQPLSPAPYALENEMMLLEVFEFNPELSKRFLPFVMVDPARAVADQLSVLEGLAERYPLYGVKVSGVECQSRVTALSAEGRPLLDFAAERDLPVLLHTTSDPEETFSHAALCFEVIEKNPHLRFCLAHCIGFHGAYLERAADMPNVWVDTSALKIQVQCARENNRIIPPPGERFDGDYHDHTAIMRALMERYPDTIIWGTDAPWYTFISRRKQGDGSFMTFRLKAGYEDEVAALNALSPDLRAKASNANTLNFLFGSRHQ